MIDSVNKQVPKMVCFFLSLNPKIPTEPQKNMNHQSNHEQEQRWRYRHTSFQNKLPSYSNQNSTEMVWKQMRTSVGQERHPRNNPDIYSQRRTQSGNRMGKLDTHKQKKEIGPLSLTTYKNQVKWLKDSHTGSETINLLEEKN